MHWYVRENSTARKRKINGLEVLWSTIAQTAVSKCFCVTKQSMDAQTQNVFRAHKKMKGKTPEAERVSSLPSLSF